MPLNENSQILRAIATIETVLQKRNHTHFRKAITDSNLDRMVATECEYYIEHLSAARNALLKLARTQPTDMGKLAKSFAEGHKLAKEMRDRKDKQITNPRSPG